MVLFIEMFMRIRHIVIFAIVLAVSAFLLEGQQPVEKTNPLKVYMHYMPWFETPETIGVWGWHWTMNTRDPDQIGTGGQREIASHYYPLIGPYASRDRDVIEYHLLLMKYSGIDGILIDWYGTVGSNGDVKELLKSSDSIVSYTDDFGMQFGVVLEDRFSRSIDDAKANMAYLRNNYFNRAEYIRYGEEEDPLVCIFGPVTFEDPADWEEILPAAGEEVELLPLWYESGDAGALADGEHSWVYQDEQDHLTHLENFYSGRAPALKTAMGSAYPGFHDFYEEGGAGSSYFTIPHNNGSTLAATLEKAGQYKDHIDMLQLVTFNDFGEGTMFEPTVETGFGYLERVQEFTGVAYGEAELILVHRLYLLRKEYADDPETRQVLDQVSLHLRNLETEQASLLLESIRPAAVSLPDDHSAGGAADILLFPNPVAEGRLNIRLDRIEGVNRMIISDIQGKVLYSAAPGPGNDLYCIDHLNLPGGVYLLTLYGGSGTSTVKFSVPD
jgi:hypothetical protein